MICGKKLPKISGFDFGNGYFDNDCGQTLLQLIQRSVQFVQLRCGTDNCQEFRSWADPKADCCISKDTTTTTAHPTDTTNFTLTAVDASEQTISLSCCNSNEVSSSADSDNLFAWDISVGDKTNIKFRFEILDIKGNRSRNRGKNQQKWGKNHKKGKKHRRKKQRNRGKKQRDGGAKQRNRGGRQNEGDSNDPCPESWVMILEGEPKKRNPHVILPKTCNDNKMEVFTKAPANYEITAFSKRVQVYFKKGNNDILRFNAGPLAPTNPPQKCLWDCKWKPNPVFQGTTFWRIGGWNVPEPCGVYTDPTKNTEVNDATMCVRIKLNMPLIPQDLNCLDDCFSDVPRRSYEARCKTGIQPAITAAAEINSQVTGKYSNDKDIDCILFNRKSEDPQPGTEAFNRTLIAEMRTRKSLFRGQDRSREKREADDLLSNLLPTEPLDNALLFCIMANLDAGENRRLPSNTTGEFYVGAPIWENKTCSAFLPKLDWQAYETNEQPRVDTNGQEDRGHQESTRVTKSFSSPSKGPLARSETMTPNTRSSGPASTIIER